MRYRLMASYLGASYQAAVGPSDRDVTLFAAPPPPEEHGFTPAPSGIWRKQVRLDDLEGLWESRPIGSYHGEPCLVLDDLGDRLHIVYLGMDGQRAAQLGYWEVDRGVFEVVVPRYDVTDLAEERHEFPIALLLAALPAPAPLALGSGAPSSADSSLPGPGGLAGPGGSGRPMQAPGGPMPGPGGIPQAPGGPMNPGGPMPGPGGQNGAGLPQQAGAMSAAAGGQQPGTGAYYSQPGVMPNGAGLPVPPGPPGVPGGQGAQFGSAAPGMPGAPGQAMPQPAMPQPAAQQQYAQQPAAQQQYAQQQYAQQPQDPQGATPQAPTAMAAWHGSPAPDGNGQWYYQQGPAQASAGSNGTAAPQYAPQAPATGYQQGPQVQPSGPAMQPQQAQPGMPGQPVQNLQPSQAAPGTQAVPAAQFAAPQTPIGQAPAPVPQASPVTAPQPAAPVPAQPARPQVQPEPPQPSVPQAAPAPLQAPTHASPAGSAGTVPANAPGEQPSAADGPPSKATGGVRGRRAARKPRLTMSAIFADLVDMADIPRSAYAVDEEVTGAMCLFKTDGGYEVFSCGEDARHEVRFFEEEESAYFYLFGVLTAEALRNGRLGPSKGSASQGSSR